MDLRSCATSGLRIPWCHNGTEPDQTMTATLDDKSRITARVPAALRNTLEQAAQLQGATLNQFVVQAAFEEAQRIVERESVIRVSQRDAERVFSLLDRPPKPNARLKEAVQSFRGKVRV